MSWAVGQLLGRLIQSIREESRWSRARTSRRTERVKPGSRPAVPLLDARYRRTRRALRAAVCADIIRPPSSSPRCSRASSSSACSRSRSASWSPTCCSTRAAWRGTTRASSRRSSPTARRPSPDASEVGSALGGAPFLPVLAAAIALVCAVLRKWRIAAFTLFALAVESATYRVDVARGAARAPARHASRRPPGQRLLPVRSHRGVRRRLCRPRAADHVAVPEPRSPVPRLGRSRSWCPPSSPCPGCTAGCTTRSTSPEGA